MRGIGFFIVTAWLASVMVSHAMTPGPCGWFSDSGYSKCVILHSGAQPAERYRDNGEELIRVLVAKGIRKVPAIVIVEVVLPREGSGLVGIRDPLNKDFKRFYAIDRARFQTLRARFLSMPAAGSDPTEAKSKDGLETVCIDPASGWIETVLQGKIRTAEFDYCQSESSYIDEILDLAAPLDAACAPLVSFEGWPADALRQCLHLRGKDRLLAASAYLASEKFSQGKIDEMIDPAMDLKISGDPELHGSDASERARGLMTGREGKKIYCYPAEAKADGDEAFVEGSCENEVEYGDGEHWLTATSLQLWKRDVAGDLKLKSWTLGQFQKRRAKL